MIYILTGTYQQAQHLARYELKLPPNEWRFVSESYRLRGTRGSVNSVMYGYGFWDRRDAAEILAIVRSQELPEYTPVTT